MSIILNGSTGITTPADTVTGNETVGGTLAVTGATTLAGTTLGATTATSLTVGGVAAVAVAPGTSGNVIFTTDGSTWSSTQKIVQGTAVASTSGTSISFTSIPSWVKRITLMLQGVQRSGSSIPVFQLGTSGGFVTTGYLGASGAITGSPGGANPTNGFTVNSSNAADVFHGQIIIENLTGNTWTAFSFVTPSNGYNVFLGAGSITAANLGGVLTQVRITMTNGTDTFTAGNINLLWE